MWTLVLQNGVGLVDASSISPDHAVASEPGEATRIEVLRGPSTLAYGGSAIGGVVNMIDDRVPTSRATRDAEGRLSASYGTADDGYALNGGLKMGWGPFVLALDAVKRESQDYRAGGPAVSAALAARAGVPRDDGHEVANSAVALQAFGAGLSYVGDNGFLGASVKRTETDYGVPYAASTAGADDEGPVEIRLRQTRVDVRGERALDLGPFNKLRASFGWANYHHAEVGAETGEIGTRFLSKGGEGRLELVQADRGGWQGAVGLQGLARSYEAIGDEAFIPPSRIREAGAFLLQRLDREKWGIEAGVRLDRRTLRASGLATREGSEAAEDAGIDWAAAPGRRSFTNLSASAAVFVRPAPKWFASLALTHNGRAPTETELYADGPHAGTGSFELGDPRLTREKANSVEASLRFAGERLRVEGHAYAVRYDGFIEEFPTGALQDELPVYRFVQTDADFVGFEVEGSYKLWRSGERALSIEAGADWVRADSDVGRPPRIPPYGVTSRLVWEDARLDAHLEVRRIGGQTRTAAYETPTDGYTLVNARLAFRPVMGSPLQLFVEGRNLTDAEAREHVSFLKDIAPLPGRSIRFGVSHSF
jgi:iron complex outermembrane recepter protein